MTAHSVAHARLRHALKRTAILAGLLCGLSLSHAHAEFPEERLDFKLTENTDGLLRFVIETSIPTPFEAIVEISLAGQQPRDVYIGHAERVFIDRPHSELVLDLRRSRMQLPAGRIRPRSRFTTPGGGATETSAPAKRPTR